MLAQVGVICFQVKVRGRPAHVAVAGSGANAIEACLQVEPEKRCINVKLTQRAGCLFIREENSKRSGSVIKEGQLTGTTKADTASHGYGARIMRDVVDRCDGTVELQETDDTFTAIVMLRPETGELQPRASLTGGR